MEIPPPVILRHSKRSPPATLVSVRGSYGGGRNLPDPGEAIGVALLAVIGIWGAWFGVQSWITLWWPINLAYFAAGSIVALVSAGVARALLNH